MGKRTVVLYYIYTTKAMFEIETLSVMLLFINNFINLSTTNTITA
jgi:hypothetical protein